MSVLPANYAVPTIVSAMPAVDSAENAARLARVEELGGIILSEDPGVSLDQKLEAFNSLSDLGGKSWRDAGARDAVSEAYWLKTESPLAKQIQAVGNRYQTMGMAAGRAAQAKGGDDEWTGSNPIAAFSKFSQDDQKVLMVALGLNTKYASVEDAYDDYQRQSDEAVARYQASKRAKPDAVSLSDEAKALLGPDGVAQVTGGAQQALATLQADKVSTSAGAVALRMLERAADAREAASAKRDADAATPRAWRLGDPSGGQVDQTV